MGTDRLEQVKQLFQAAIELEPSQRTAFLEAAQILDPSIREEVDSLISSHKDANSFLEKPPLNNLEDGGTPFKPDTEDIETLSIDQQRRKSGQQIGSYRLLREIGQGGMGIVYEAEQQKPVRRRVALKLIKRGMDTKAVIARFESERQALALMNHPNIATVHDAGTTELGRPYFAMELVHGEPITQYCEKNRLTIRERLDLFVQVCEGVQHAHQKGIIHRDIKPSNILVTIQDDNPVPKIIDFGVAKATSQRLTEKTVNTEMGQLIGTPEYMSPEQAEMTGIDIDTRTDVYSLGVVLYELLVGTQPFDTNILRGASFDDMRRMIREEEPSKPSTKLSQADGLGTKVARDRRADLRALERELRGDLDWITMKALEKNRTRRYGSPSELVADIERHFQNVPVVARPPSNMYRMNRFVRRHKFGVGALTAMFILLTTFAVAMAVQADRIADERDRANRESAVAMQISEFLTGIFEVSDPGEALGNTITAREILDHGASDISETLADQPEVQFRLMATMGKVYTNLGLYNAAEPLLQKSVNGQREALGLEDPSTLTSMHNLANLFWYQGRFGDAEPIYRELVEARRRVLGPDHPDTLKAQYDWASLYMWLERYDEMERLSLETLEAQRRALGENHPDTLATMNNLGGLYFSQERYEECAPIFSQVLEQTQRLLGREHPDTLQAMHNLANSYFKLHRYEEAEQLMTQVTSLRRRVLGNTHRHTANSVGWHGEFHMEQGHYEEAESLLLESYDAFVASVGQSHPRTARAVQRLVQLYAAWGRPEKAAEYRAMLEKS